MLDEHFEGRAPEVGLVDVVGTKAQVFAHADGVHGEEPGGGEAVDVAEVQAGIGQRPLRGLGVDLVLAEVGEVGIVGRGHPDDHCSARGTHNSGAR